MIQLLKRGGIRCDAWLLADVPTAVVSSKQVFIECRRIVALLFAAGFLVSHALNAHAQNLYYVEFGNVPLGFTRTIPSSFQIWDGSGVKLPYNCMGHRLVGPNAGAFTSWPNYAGLQMVGHTNYPITNRFSPIHVGDYYATNLIDVENVWFYGTVHIVLHGKGTEAPSVLPLRVGSTGYKRERPGSLNDPIVPASNSTVLGSQQLLGRGVAGDDVTPVLFALSMQPGTYSLEMSCVDSSSGSAVYYNGGSLISKLRVLTGDVWSATTTITITAGHGATVGTNYAYLEGLTWRNFTGVTAPNNEVIATLRLKWGATEMANASFRVRPPPVALVHGIADNGQTWSLTNALHQRIPRDFVTPITYGAGNGSRQRWPCSTKHLTDLLTEVHSELRTAEAAWRQDWAFTRYDAVGHSQGGVLLRYLCQTAGLEVPLVVSDENAYRGRFRRIVTIGAPQNGSLIAYYVRQMQGSISPLDLAEFNTLPLLMPAIMKFNPEGDDVRRLNNPRFPVDARIPFHCIQTAIQGGAAPGRNAATNAHIYNWLGLDHVIATGTDAGKTRGEVLLPYGADGVVDTESQGGGRLTSKGLNFLNIAHADHWLFAVGDSTPDTQTASAAVGERVGGLLGGPDENFGPFIIPTQLTEAEKTRYKRLVPRITRLPGIVVRAILHKFASTNLEFTIDVPAEHPLEGMVNWTAQVYGTNGIATDGLTITPIGPQSMTLGIDGAVVGQVVLSASYMSSSGDIITTTPLVVLERPVTEGAVITKIVLDPPTAELNIGDALQLEAWATYSDGAQFRLFIPPDGTTFTSSNTNIATVSPTGLLLLNAQGKANAFLTYGNLFARCEVSTAKGPKPQLFLNGIKHGGFEFALLGSVGITNVVEASTNLVDWTRIATVCPTDIETTLTDSNALTFPRRFYRAVVP